MGTVPFMVIGAHNGSWLIGVGLNQLCKRHEIMKKAGKWNESHATKNSYFILEYCICESSFLANTGLLGFFFLGAV